jgi:anti-sigma28 factor (negative regulator of flagellin synthesis)
MDISPISGTFNAARSWSSEQAAAGANKPAPEPAREADRFERRGPEVFRSALVENVRAQIAQGTYMTSERLDKALERLIGHLDVTA